MLLSWVRLRADQRNIWKISEMFLITILWFSILHHEHHIRASNDMNAWRPQSPRAPPYCFFVHKSASWDNKTPTDDDRYCCEKVFQTRHHKIITDPPRVALQLCARMFMRIYTCILWRYRKGPPCWGNVHACACLCMWERVCGERVCICDLCTIRKQIARAEMMSGAWSYACVGACVNVCRASGHARIYTYVQLWECARHVLQSLVFCYLLSARHNIATFQTSRLCVPIYKYSRKICVFRVYKCFKWPISCQRRSRNCKIW